MHKNFYKMQKGDIYSSHNNYLNSFFDKFFLIENYHYQILSPFFIICIWGDDDFLNIICPIFVGLAGQDGGVLLGNWQQFHRHTPQFIVRIIP